jgi:hypothetical protein
MLTGSAAAVHSLLVFTVGDLAARVALGELAFLAPRFRGRRSASVAHRDQMPHDQHYPNTTIATVIRIETPHTRLPPCNIIGISH